MQNQILLLVACDVFYDYLILEINLLETIILWLIGCVAMLQLASGDSCEYFLFKLLNYSLIEWLHCNFSVSHYSEECDANIFVSRAQLRWLLCKIFCFFFAFSLLRWWLMLKILFIHHSVQKTLQKIFWKYGEHVRGLSIKVIPVPYFRAK